MAKTITFFYMDNLIINTTMSTELENQIENGEIDADDLKAEFNEYLYAKGYECELVWSFSDEHFENLLSFEANEIKFIKFINQ